MFKMNLNTLYSLNDYLNDKTLDIPLEDKRNIVKIYYSNLVLQYAIKNIKNTLLLESLTNIDKVNNYNDFFKFTNISIDNKKIIKKELTIDEVLNYSSKEDIYITSLNYNEDALDKESLTYYDLNDTPPVPGFDESTIDEEKGLSLMNRMKKLKEQKHNPNN